MNTPNFNPGMFIGPGASLRDETPKNKGGNPAPFILFAVILIIAGVVGGVVARLNFTSKNKTTSERIAVVEKFYQDYENGDPTKAYSEYTVIDEDFYNEYGPTDKYEYDEFCELDYSDLTDTYGNNFKIEITDAKEEKMSDSELEDLKEKLEEYDIGDIDEAYNIEAELSISGEGYSDEWVVIKRSGEYKIVPKYLTDDN